MEIFLSIVYILLFILLIYRMKFFECPDLSRKSISLIFGLKIISGLALWLIYTRYYTDRSTADIFKYFDDSKVMFDSIHSRPLDFLQMLTGIGNNSPGFDAYYNQMHNWVKVYDSNLYNDSHTIIRFNALLRIFSFGYYQVHSVFLCFLSLSGLVAIYRCFAPYLAGKRILAIVCIFLFPSVLFWGSGVLKEGILFYGMGMLIYYWFKVSYEKISVYALAWITFCLILLLATKFYILVSLLPGLLYIFWIARSSRNNLFLKFCIVIICYGALGLGVKYFIPAYDPLQILAIKQQDFLSLARGGIFLKNDTAEVFLSQDQRAQDLIKTDNPKIWHIRSGASYCYWHDYNADIDTLFGKQPPVPTDYRMENDVPRSGSLIAVQTLKPTLTSFVESLPMAWVNTLFRPLPTEARSPLLLPPCLEIIAYTLFFLLCIVYRKKEGVQAEYVLFCLSFVFILFAITGLTTPVLGALVRYKIPGIPFLMMSFLFLLDEKALIRSFPRLGKYLTR
jgi:hypothetical protein